MVSRAKTGLSWRRAYSVNNLLGDLNERVMYVGVMRADAAIYDVRVPKQSKSKRGPKPRKGPRSPTEEAVKKADGNRGGSGPWTWQTVKAEAYGVTRKSAGAFLSGNLARSAWIGADLWCWFATRWASSTTSICSQPMWMPS